MLVFRVLWLGFGGLRFRVVLVFRVLWLGLGVQGSG